MRRTVAIVGLLLSAACSGSTVQAPAATTAVVFDGARVIVGDGSAPIEDARIVVDNGRFVQVGRA